MAVVKKRIKMRICIAPQPLNEALLRKHYKMPTLDDVLPHLHNAKIHSKLDVKEAFWHVNLPKRIKQVNHNDNTILKVQMVLLATWSQSQQ